MYTSDELNKAIDEVRAAAATEDGGSRKGRDVAASWQNPDVRRARSARYKVKANGVVCKSMASVLCAYHLPASYAGVMRRCLIQAKHIIFTSRGGLRLELELLDGLGLDIGAADVPAVEWPAENACSLLTELKRRAAAEPAAAEK